MGSPVTIRRPDQRRHCSDKVSGVLIYKQGPVYEELHMVKEGDCKADSMQDSDVKSQL